MLPISSKSGMTLPFLDALFTATSATCVTGLIVAETGTYFSLFGQIVGQPVAFCGSLFPGGGRGLLSGGRLLIKGGLFARAQVQQQLVRVQLLAGTAEHAPDEQVDLVAQQPVLRHEPRVFRAEPGVFRDENLDEAGGRRQLPALVFRHCHGLVFHCPG